LTGRRDGKMIGRPRGGESMRDRLDQVVEPGEPVRLATGLEFTEGPLWHPDGFFYFVDLRSQPSRLLRLVPGGTPELVMATAETNGTTFDIDGNLLMCESGRRRIARLTAGGAIEAVAERYEGHRFNRPNDIVCRSDGSIYFTDPGLRVPLAERELPYGGVYRVGIDGGITLIADCEYPNGLAFSPDERTLYVSNTRWTEYVHAFDLTPDGTVARRRIFADMSAGEGEGVPDGMKVDAAGRVFCTGRGGIWVFEPSGDCLGVLQFPEPPANLAFGGPDLRTLFATARTSIYSLRARVPGQPHPWYARRQR
jgi:gluconolactonase